MKKYLFLLLNAIVMVALMACSESGTSSNDDDDDDNNNSSGLNFSFEDWSGGAPVNWTTSNIPNVFTNITESGDAQNGSAAVKGEIVSFQGAPLNASIATGTAIAPYLEIDQKISKVKLYYKFLPQASGESLFIQVNIFSDYPTGLLAFETFSIDQEATGYTLLSLDMPPQAETPKLIQIAINSLGQSIGTYFLIDNITLE